MVMCGSRPVLVQLLTTLATISSLSCPRSVSDPILVESLEPDDRSALLWTMKSRWMILTGTPLQEVEATASEVAS